jgi:hypothetical protein
MLKPRKNDLKKQISTMKNTLYALICLLLLACSGTKTKNTTQEESTIMEQGPKQWLTFEGNGSDAKHVVLVSGDEEYRSEEALPQLAKILSKRHGFKCTVLFAQDPEKPGVINANYLKNIPGLENLNTADMMVIFTRFRALPNDQMQYIDNYLKTGKPVMGIRTSTHAFNFGKDSLTSFMHYTNGYKGDKTEWADGFGRFILGEKWISHHGHHKHQSTRGLIAPGAEDHPITNGIEDGDVWGATDVYEARLPLPGDSQPIILGEIMNRKGEYDETDIFFGMKPTDDVVAAENKKGVNVNDPMMPVSWTKSYQVTGGKKGRVFTTTVGAANDMLIEGCRRLLVNSVFWALDLPVPDKANVEIIGEYNPTKFEFRKPEYWIEKNLMVADME